jgi:hypothetical protein
VEVYTRVSPNMLICYVAMMDGRPFGGTVLHVHVCSE